jgi:hypothetical protein
MILSKSVDPLLFKIFINDIFYFIEYGTLYNYADDNTLSYVNDNYEKLIDIPEKESSELIDWFKFNPHTDFYLELFSNLQGVSAKLSDNHDPF